MNWSHSEMISLCLCLAGGAHRGKQRTLWPWGFRAYLLSLHGQQHVSLIGWCFKSALYCPLGRTKVPELLLAYFRRFCEPKWFSDFISIQDALSQIPALQRSPQPLQHRKGLWIKVPARRLSSKEHTSSEERAKGISSAEVQKNLYIVGFLVSMSLQDALTTSW